MAMGIAMYYVLFWSYRTRVVVERPIATAQGKLSVF